MTAFIVSCQSEELSRHVHELAENILSLSTHTYANHVVQTWIERIGQMTNERAPEKVAINDSRSQDHVSESSEQTAAARNMSSLSSIADFCVNTVVQGIQSSLFELSMDKHGAFVVCTALRAFDQSRQCAPLVHALCKGTDMLRIARTQYGCQLLQKWSEIASTEQLQKMSSALSRNFAATSRDKFGNHFVLKMITFISPSGVLNTGGGNVTPNATLSVSDAEKHKQDNAQHSQGLMQLCHNLAYSCRASACFARGSTRVPG